LFHEDAKRQGEVPLLLCVSLHETKFKKINMPDISLELNEKGRGSFYLSEGSERIGEMEVAISKDTLIVYHTEVGAAFEGKGYAKQLLNAMVEHARNNHLKVIALCPYVHLQFSRHPEQYADIWQKDISHK
jgi:uncharacterized protein